MKVLALDTSTKFLSLALEVNGQCSEENVLAGQNHGALILSLIHNLLTQADCSIKEIDLLAFGNGPGSFTGLRLAAAIVQACALPFATKIIGISTLRAMAQQAYRRYGIESCLCALDARTHQIYLGHYANQNGFMLPESQEILIAPKIAADTIPPQSFLVGEGFLAYQDHFLEKNYFTEVKLPAEIWPQARDILALAKWEYAQGTHQTALNIELNYLNTPRYGTVG